MPRPQTLNSKHFDRDEWTGGWIQYMCCRFALPLESSFVEVYLPLFYSNAKKNFYPRIVGKKEKA